MNRWATIAKVVTTFFMVAVFGFVLAIGGQALVSCADDDDCDCDNISDDDNSACTTKEWPETDDCGAYEEGQAWFAIENPESAAGCHCMKSFESATVDIADDVIRFVIEDWQLTMKWQSTDVPSPFYSGQTVYLAIYGDDTVDGPFYYISTWILDEQKNTILFETKIPNLWLYKVEEHATLFDLQIGCEYRSDRPPSADESWDRIFGMKLSGGIDRIAFQAKKTNEVTTSIDGNYRINIPYNFMGVNSNTDVSYSYGIGESVFLLQMVRIENQN